MLEKELEQVRKETEEARELVEHYLGADKKGNRPRTSKLMGRDQEGDDELPEEVVKVLEDKKKASKLTVSYFLCLLSCFR